MIQNPAGIENDFKRAFRNLQGFFRHFRLKIASAATRGRAPGNIRLSGTRAPRSGFAANRPSGRAARESCLNGGIEYLPHRDEIVYL
jgi:hypothetical protein